MKLSNYFKSKSYKPMNAVIEELLEGRPIRLDIPGEGDESVVIDTEGIVKRIIEEKREVKE